MSTDRYDPVPVPTDLDATRKRWMERPGFREAYEVLVDEYVALDEPPRRLPGVRHHRQFRPGHRGSRADTGTDARPAYVAVAGRIVRRLRSIATAAWVTFHRYSSSDALNIQRQAG